MSRPLPGAMPGLLPAAHAFARMASAQTGPVIEVPRRTPGAPARITPSEPSLGRIRNEHGAPVCRVRESGDSTETETTAPRRP